MTQAFPLQWPAGVPRTDAWRRAIPQFVTTLGKATAFLLGEVRRMGGTSAVISANLSLRNDGLPYSNQRQPDDSGVAVYFMRRGKQLVFACDRWAKVEHNIQAIAKTIEAMRGIERWGSAEMMDRAFTGFAALPAPEQWWQVLGVDQGASAAEIAAAYRRLATEAHPDRPGGSDAAMARLNAARDAAKREIG